MKHIHYKNDFEFLLKIIGKDGAVRPVPQYRWSVVFSVGRVCYECSLRDGNAVVKGDTIVCRLQDHGFGCGELKAEFREWIPNKDWLDGVVDVSTPIDTDIELWEGKSDEAEEMVSGSVVSAYFVYDAYLTAKANGYTGTADEYYNALTGVVGIAEAEAGRVSSEELREANEQQRVLEFDAMKAKVDNVYTKAESDARYLRGEVLYEDYYYPNMSPTTDTTRFTDSTEILQPTNFIESYTDADGTTWSNVFECESFPDWFDLAERECHPYDNGISTAMPFFKNYTINDGELVYNFDSMQNINISKKLPHFTNYVGLKKIDDNHFHLYTTKDGAVDFTAFDKENVDCSLFAFGSLVNIRTYDIDDCKRFRVSLIGNFMQPSRYSTIISTGSDIGIKGYVRRQQLYGNEYVDLEIDKLNKRYRQIGAGYSMWHRTSHTQNWNQATQESFYSQCTLRWEKIVDGPAYGVSNLGGKLIYSFNGYLNPTNKLVMGCKIKIEKLA